MEELTNKGIVHRLYQLPRARKISQGISNNVYDKEVMAMTYDHQALFTSPGQP